MRNKLTTDYILEMLKEVKSLCDTNSFNSAKFIKSHPHFNSVLKVIQAKGILNKSKKEFTNIEPNDIMAKEVLRLVLEERKELLDNVKMDSITKEEYKINSEKLASRVQSLELELLHTKTDYKDLKDSKDQEIKTLNEKIRELNSVVYEKNDSVKHYVKTNTRLEEKIIENNELISNYKTKSEERIKSLKEKEKLIVENDELIVSLKEEILEMKHIINFQIQKIQKQKDTIDTPKKTTPKASIVKTVRFLGFPIYSSETK